VAERGVLRADRAGFESVAAMAGDGVACRASDCWCCCVNERACVAVVCCTVLPGVQGRQ
jgi:hypothetical protein